MNMVALLIAAIPTFGVCVHEVGALLRQREAIRSLERLAENHPDSAALVAGVIEAARPSRESLGVRMHRGPR
jgi:hypothetical protein